MSDASDFFEAQVVLHARTLSVPEARRFLRGLLESIEGDAFANIRLAYTNLCIADDQFELIAHPQGRLPFNGKDGTK